MPEPSCGQFWHYTNTWLLLSLSAVPGLLHPDPALLKTWSCCSLLLWKRRDCEIFASISEFSTDWPERRSRDGVMAQVDGVFAEKLQTNVRDSKVLMVGAGGIGCELLKNLVLSGRSIKIAHILKFSLSLGWVCCLCLTISSPFKICLPRIALPLPLSCFAVPHKKYC